MRHNVYGRHLGRNKNERTALFRNLVQSLFLEEKIVTSEAKAKAIKGTVDKLINQAKTPINRKQFNQFVTQKKTQEKLVKDLLPKLKGRTSGYTSIVKLGRRLGDNTPMVQVSLLLDEVSGVSKDQGVKVSKAEESNLSDSPKTSNPSGGRKTTKKESK